MKYIFSRIEAVVSSKLLHVLLEDFFVRTELYKNTLIHLIFKIN